MTPVGPDRRSEALRAANRARPRRRAGDWGRVLLAAVVLYLILRTFVAEAYRIPSASMTPTLLAGDFVLVNKLRYGATVPFTAWRLPGVQPLRHNDVLVFAWPVDPDKHFVKRLLGLPGDTLRLRDGHLERNGRVVRAPADTARGAGGWPADGQWGPVVVPAQYLFVLGDNRGNSLDSRYWGLVPVASVIGSPWRVYFSHPPDSARWLPRAGRIRWDRIGRAVQ